MTTTKKSSWLIGNRIPRDFFITQGHGESDLAVHAGSYHLALQQAGIERFNIMNYSSILPAIAREIPQPKDYVHGSVAETISAVAHAEAGQRATAGIIYGWLIDPKTEKKYGGLVCEYSDHDPVEIAEKSLEASLEELYQNGFSEQFLLRGQRLITESFVPSKKFGTALVALVFANYVYPVLEDHHG